MHLSFPEPTSKDESQANHQNFMIVFGLIPIIVLFYFGIFTYEVLLIEPDIYLFLNIFSVVTACYLSISKVKRFNFFTKDWLSGLGLFFGFLIFLHVLCCFSLPWVLHHLVSSHSTMTVKIERISYDGGRGGKFFCKRVIRFEQYRWQMFGARVCNIKPELFKHLKKGDEIILAGERSVIGFSPNLSKLQ